MRDGPREFAPDSSCPGLLRILLCFFWLRIRGSHPLCRILPSASARRNLAISQSYNPTRSVNRMVWAPPRSLATTWGITCCFLFLPLLRCFSSRRSPRIYGNGSSIHWVAPFGDVRITGHLHLPEPYRSLSRPSSPSRAKASACCPFLLLFFRTRFLSHCLRPCDPNLVLKVTFSIGLIRLAPHLYD